MDNIKQIIGERIKELRISTLNVSFNELADMYENDELIIKPEYQRTFRWDIGKQSRFIESLLMEMPVPPIYVIEVEDGKYELIDGLQRISSYLSYRELLKLDNLNVEEFPVATDNDECQEDDIDDTPDAASLLKKGFALEGCDIIKELNGLSHCELQASMQIKLKRAFVKLEVLRQGINPEMKYHMFKRLNIGGERLSDQEVRNCTIRLIDDKFINFIKELTTDTCFKNTIAPIGKSRIMKRYDEELVLRYFAFKNSYASFKHDVGEFLTQYMENVSMNDMFDYDCERDIFQKTFRFLDEACGDKVFCRINLKTKTQSGFSAYLFEAIAVGVQDYVEVASSDPSKYESFKQALITLKTDIDFRDATIGGGKNSPGPMNKRRERVKEMMKGLYE
jgi:hypothetical protein